MVEDVQQALQQALQPPLEIEPISDREFALFQRLIYRLAGISMADSKKVLMVGRLSRRLRHYQLSTFGDYYRLLASGEHPDEVQLMVDLLTTNETYFFREPQHFEFQRQLAEQARGRMFRVWSGACSSGEEPYTMAMVLAETLGLNAAWEVVATDISLTVLAKAERGQYPMERAEGVPLPLLKKYCLKGVREQAGTLLIDRPLRERVRFRQFNLIAPDSTGDMGLFDVIFLRNVMIYFDNETKARVVANMLPFLRHEGYFVIGHSETLNRITDEVVALRPTIYRRPGVA